MEGQKVKITVKLAADKTFDVEVELSSTVLQLKQLCEKQTGAKPEEQKIIFKGKILKDTDVLSAVKIENGITVHMVR